MYLSIGNTIYIYINIFYDLMFSSLPFLLVSSYQAPIDVGIALGSAPNCFQSSSGRL